MKKPRRHTPTVIAESESAAVALTPAPLIIKLSAQKQTTDKAIPALGKTSSIFVTHIYTYTYTYVYIFIF